MQGWAPDFIPKLTGDVVDMQVIDRVITVAGGCDALQPGPRPERRDLCRDHLGATFAGALQVCQEAPTGSTVHCMLPDTGERYLSTPLFADIPADMSPEELEIARSTP